MTNNVKISLNITLQGSTLVRQEETIVLTGKNIKTGKPFKKKRKVTSLVPKRAVLTKNLTKEAYDYFTSMESCPQFKQKEWRKMSPKERLEYHTADLCKFYRGTSYTYHVFED